MIHSARSVTDNYSFARKAVRRAIRHAPAIVEPLCVLAGLPASLFITLQVLAAQMRHCFLKQLVGHGFRIAVHLIIPAIVVIIAVCFLLRLAAYTLLKPLGRPAGWRPEDESFNEPSATRILICRDDAKTGF